MANPMKGEASLTTAAGETLTVCFDFAAMCATEEVADKDWNAIMVGLSESGKPKLRLMAAVLSGGLARYHPEIDFDAIGDLVQTDGLAVMDALQRAISAARARSGNPPKGVEAQTRRPRPGTGTPSSKRGAK